MRLAFVIPWYGEHIPGGAEFAMRRLAEELAARRRSVEVLTTCIKDFYSDWSTNFHREGVTTENGVPVRRFLVKRRNLRAFDELNGRLLRGETLTRDEERRFMNEMIISPGLIRFIAAHRREYQFFFTPYLFSTSYFGVRACPDRAWLVPRLHDESYAYLQLTREMFEAAQGVLFLSPPEMTLAQRLYQLGRARIGLIGDGVDAGLPGDAQRFRDQTGVREPFVLYVGRRDPTKNVPLLIDYYRRYRASRDNALKLVLMGSGNLNDVTARSDELIDLGFVSPQDKADAIAAANVLCQPSKNESFSLVIMEAWLAGTPVLVHADCAVTADHCRRSNGGLYFSDYAEFAGCLDFFSNQLDIARRMGQLGRQYVRANFDWDKVIRRFDHFTQL